METLRYEKDGRVARITLDRPERGNGINRDMTRELPQCVEEANLDPDIHVIALAGEGKGFCGGYDLVWSAEETLPNHEPGEVWDPVLDWQFMSRNVRGFMSLFHSDKPVVCKVHGFCVAGGTDMALCSDLLVIADDARIGYPPARVWGSPTTAMWFHRLGLERAKRLLLTGDPMSREAVANLARWVIDMDDGRQTVFRWLAPGDTGVAWPLTGKLCGMHSMIKKGSPSLRSLTLSRFWTMRSGSAKASGS